MQVWLKFWLNSLRLARIKIIWTAHNLIPHKSIFNNDFAMRKYLITHCAAVIALSEQSKFDLISSFEAKNVVVIAEGAISHPTTYSREAMKALLGVGEDQILLIALGHLAPYKGIEELINAAVGFSPEIALRIAGWCDPEYTAKLKILVRESNLAGANIQINFGRLVDNLYGGYLHAADFYIAPFNQVTNSGSINAALTAGLPAIIPDLNSLSWVPEKSAIRFSVELDRVSALTSIVNSVKNIPQGKLVELRQGASDFNESHNWALVATLHHQIYEKMIGQRDELRSFRRNMWG